MSAKMAPATPATTIVASQIITYVNGEIEKCAMWCIPIAP
jgi:hypothetical protein